MERYFCMVFTAPITLISKSFLKSSSFNLDIGFKLILPGQYIIESASVISGS